MAKRGRKSRAELAFQSIEPAALRPSLALVQPASSPEPPSHFGEAEQRIWRDIFSDYEFSTKTAIAVLTTALEAHQRARECREAILREGMTVVGRDGQAKVHPLLAVERDARQAFLSAVSTLGLEL